jgi:predicted dehydrogenase
MTTHEVYSRKLRMGMIGGGPGAFIGEVHRKAARLDGHIELVAGAFSRDPEKSKHAGRELFLDPKRVYGSYREMITAEQALSPEARIDVVSIVTPNDSHFEIAAGFLNAGFHVVLDKPLTLNLEQALELKNIVEASGKVFALTHNYTGYPMVKLARDMIRQGDLGELRKIKVQYPQGWLHTLLEATGAKQAAWRTDPAQAGAAGCMGDIGTHAENLAHYITGLDIVELCADLTTFVEGRKLEDDGNCLVHWDKGVKGLLFASQISAGEENDLAIWVYGAKAGLEWHQENPNVLYLKKPNAPLEVWRRGNDYIGAKSPAAARATRLPFGHPEAFIEAFANIYVNAAETIRAVSAREQPSELALDFPNIHDGVRGMQFVDAAVRSAREGARWVKLR